MAEREPGAENATTTLAIDPSQRFHRRMADITQQLSAELDAAQEQFNAALTGLEYNDACARLDKALKAICEFASENPDRVSLSLKWERGSW